MPTYGSATFRVQAEQQDNTLVRPDTEYDPGIVSTKIPYANVELLQFTGRTNEKLRLTLYFESDANYLLFKSYLGDGIARTLTDPFSIGVNFPNAHLTALTEPRRVTYEQAWTCKAEFTMVSL